MPLHTVDQRSDDNDDTAAVYATDLSMRTLPRRRMPDHGSPAAVAYALVRDELILDGNSRQNLATFEIGMLPNDVRVYELANDRFVGRPALSVLEALHTPVLRLTRDGEVFR